MTPGARVAAAIEVLDGILDGLSAEQALSRWARSSRFAGSKDRAAIRDHVFDALRCKRSYAWLGGAETGRGLMIGACLDNAIELSTLFSGDGHAPQPVGDGENTGAALDAAPRGVQGDMPDWLLPLFDEALEDADDVLGLLRHRAGLFLRVNVKRASREDVAASLAEEGIETVALDNISSALQVLTNPRRVAQSAAYADGLVEVQDTASQLAMSRLGLVDGMRVLDLCAGGGGKTLAMGALADVALFAHDIDPRRMVDLAPRAQRAGLDVQELASEALAAGGPYDLILCDAPCSGSGTWRRAPEAKWALTPDRLAELTEIQDEILDQAAGLVAPGGRIAYATCSVFKQENEARIAAFQGRHSSVSVLDEMRLRPDAQQDGFYLALLGL